MSEKYRFGAYAGRFCPSHKGHQLVYEAMASRCEQYIVFVGSANAPWSLPLFFDYSERVAFLRTLYPDIRILPLPDFETNTLWLDAISDMLRTIGFDPDDTVFFGGCEEDVVVLSQEGGFRTHLLNRFDGTTPVVSATEIRDSLIHGRPLDGLLDPRIHDIVKATWNEKWPQFLKKR